MCPVNSRIIELQFSCIALFTLESVQIHDGEIKHGLQAERKIDCLQVSNFLSHLNFYGKQGICGLGQI